MAVVDVDGFGRLGALDEWAPIERTDRSDCGRAVFDRDPDFIDRPRGGLALGRGAEEQGDGNRGEGAQRDAPGSFTDGGHPGQCERRVTALMAPGVEMITDRRAVHAVFFGEHPEFD